MTITNKDQRRNTLLAKVHLAKSQLKLSDQDYRDILSGWSGMFGDTIGSASAMSYEQLIELLDVFEKKLGWVPQPRKKDKKFIKPAVDGKRDSAFATSAQLEKINLLWVKHSRKGDAESLRLFVKRILHIDLLQSIQSNQVHVLVAAIENLKSTKKEGEL